MTSIPQFNKHLIRKQETHLFNTFFISAVIPHIADVGAKVTTAPLPPQPTVDIPTGPGNCDFESGLCSYTQDTTDDIDWVQKQGAASGFLIKTGPPYDHTKQDSSKNAVEVVAREGYGCSFGLTVLNFDAMF